MWILARTQRRYYGAYPEGFLWRAKAMMPGEMCHLCSGTVRGDFTVDINPDMNPDLVGDARDTGLPGESFDAVLIDPPYSPEDAEKYGTDYPRPAHLMREGYRLVRPGGRVGMLHHIWPQPPAKGVRCLAIVGVVVGTQNRIRQFTVYEKPQADRTTTSEHQDIMSYGEEKD